MATNFPGINNYESNDGVPQLAQNEQTNDGMINALQGPSKITALMMSIMLTFSTFTNTLSNTTFTHTDGFSKELGKNNNEDTNDIFNLDTPPNVKLEQAKKHLIGEIEKLEIQIIKLTHKKNKEGLDNYLAELKETIKNIESTGDLEKIAEKLNATIEKVNTGKPVTLKDGKPKYKANLKNGESLPEVELLEYSSISTPKIVFESVSDEKELENSADSKQLKESLTVFSDMVRLYGEKATELAQVEKSLFEQEVKKATLLGEIKALNTQIGAIGSTNSSGRETTEGSGSTQVGKTNQKVKQITQQIEEKETTLADTQKKINQLTEKKDILEGNGDESVETAQKNAEEAIQTITTNVTTFTENLTTESTSDVEKIQGLINQGAIEIEKKEGEIKSDITEFNNTLEKQNITQQTAINTINNYFNTALEQELRDSTTVEASLAEMEKVETQVDSLYRKLRDDFDGYRNVIETQVHQEGAAALAKKVASKFGKETMEGVVKQIRDETLKLGTRIQQLNIGSLEQKVTEIYETNPASAAALQKSVTNLKKIEKQLKDFIGKVEKEEEKVQKVEDNFSAQREIYTNQLSYLQQTISVLLGEIQSEEATIEINNLETSLQQLKEVQSALQSKIINLKSEKSTLENRFANNYSSTKLASITDDTEKESFLEEAAELNQMINNLNLAIINQESIQQEIIRRIVLIKNGSNEGKLPQLKESKNNIVASIMNGVNKAKNIFSKIKPYFTGTSQNTKGELSNPGKTIYGDTEKSLKETQEIPNFSGQK